MRSSLIILLGVVLLVVSVFFNIRLTLSKNSVKIREIQKYTDSLDRLYWLNQYLESELNLNHKYSGLKIPKIEGVQLRKERNQITNDDLQMHDILSISSGKDILIFRYSDIGCSSCSIEFISKLKEHELEIEKKYRIVFLVDFNRESDFFRWLRVSGVVDLSINVECYRVKNNSLDSLIDIHSNSYVTILSRSREIISIFTPNKLYESHIDYFINSVLYN